RDPELHRVARLPGSRPARLLPGIAHRDFPTRAARLSTGNGLSLQQLGVLPSLGYHRAGLGATLWGGPARACPWASWPARDLLVPGRTDHSIPRSWLPGERGEAPECCLPEYAAPHGGWQPVFDRS